MFIQASRRYRVRRLLQCRGVGGQTFLGDAWMGIARLEIVDYGFLCGMIYVEPAHAKKPLVRPHGQKSKLVS
jgi:hypothetical protein